MRERNGIEYLGDVGEKWGLSIWEEMVREKWNIIGNFKFIKLGD